MSHMVPRRALPHILKRLSSTVTITTKATPSKTHHHTPIPSSSFPQGFVLTGLHCGVKKSPNALDLAVVLSTTEKPAAAAGCFTRNAFKAAPVLVCQEILEGTGGGDVGRARAVVVNSGCANAVTGKQGLEDAWAMVRATDALLPTSSFGSEGFEGKPETLVMSTGVIGVNLPIAKILAGIESQNHTPSTLGADFESWERAARAFMTTDTFPKLRARTFTVGGNEYKMAGMSKGAGMIHPDMGPTTPAKTLHATLLSVILTDAPIAPRALQSALTYATDRSFNSISVDGDMSTNDTIIVLANGAAGGAEIEEGHAGYEVFRDELTGFAAELAQLVVRDGEGATKFVTVSVHEAPSYADAHAIASKISTSALVKTALYGEDANWGRILAATGAVPLPSSSTLDPARVSVSFLPADRSAPLPVLVNGEPQKVDEARAKEILQEEEFEVEVKLGMGAESAQYWTCDFSYEYVKINGDYRS
ncbi:arginine biosynthesis bifunctional protein ARG7 [Athelia psychrophila]|uniref:Arginine biosynthesis bifunctional protein ArgJ, mitochondrial n=1 Tax=Athelia psychrophila TaxID=1759441 RepID=A0A166DC57_9AGAM|nr:arginine biosynthesis bifunctional protein ARG7 [Fibularhizoctonia sp. CBS 109695]